MAQNRKQDASGKPQTADKEAGGGKQQKVSFQEFVYLMSSQALIQMGSVPNPVTGKAEKSLPAAQHAIEILAMLEQKTKGNLSDEEAKVLSNALYDLRLRYVAAVQAEQSAKKKSNA